MRRPPLAVILVGLFVIALGETAGAVTSQLRPQIAGYAAARIGANPSAMASLAPPSTTPEVIARAVYAAEAGLSFFHTHAQGWALS